MSQYCSPNTSARARPGILAGLLGLVMTASPALGQESSADAGSGWFARAWGGYSSLADTDGSFIGSDDTGSADVSVSGGFTAGAAAGYRYGPRLAVELAWEYRSNDSETDLDPGPFFDDGNYASNTFFLNGYYYLNSRGAWEPYLGAGLAWIQEVDLDLEGNGPEQSYSGDGDFGFQVFAGTNYRLNERWSLQGELRYGSVTGIDLVGEGNGGRFSDFDYQPFTAQLGLRYEF